MASTIRVPDILPPLRLSTPDGAPRRIQPTPRDALVLIWLDGADREAMGYIAELARAAKDIEYWYAHIVVVVAEDVRDLSDSGLSLDVRLDDGALARQLGLDGHRAVLIIADRYGQVYFTERAESASELPDAGEVEQWTRFLATQCPECGVIDEPS